MVKKALVIVLVFCGMNLFSQTSDLVVKEGLLRFQGTIGMGKSTDRNENNIFLHGNLEYFIHSFLTVRADVYFFLPNEDNRLDVNHQLFSGMAYHFKTESNFVPYIGVQPGLAATRYDGISKTEVTPLVSGIAGFNYFAAKWFHLFIDVRFVSGKHLSNLPPYPINEIRLSFGLGFNIATKKNK